METISSIGVEHALVFTATGDSVAGGSVMMRHYMVRLKHLTSPAHQPRRLNLAPARIPSPNPIPNPNGILPLIPDPDPQPQQVKLKKSAEASGPYVDLAEIGPSLDLAVRRVQPASQIVTKDTRGPTLTLTPTPTPTLTPTLALTLSRYAACTTPLRASQRRL